MAYARVMHALRLATRLCLVLGFTLAAHTALFAQTTEQHPAPSVPYDPTVGQQGKDVVWVPTSSRWSRRCSTWRR